MLVFMMLCASVISSIIYYLPPIKLLDHFANKAQADRKRPPIFLGVHPFSRNLKSRPLVSRPHPWVQIETSEKVT